VFVQIVELKNYFEFVLRQQFFQKKFSKKLSVKFVFKLTFTNFQHLP